MSALFLLALACQDVEALVQQLGAESYADRDAAMTALSEMGVEIETHLRPHLRHRDQEVCQRVGALIAAIDRINLVRGLVLSIEPDGEVFQISLANQTREPQVFYRRSGFLVTYKYAGEGWSFRFGGYGSTGCNLFSDAFVTIQPGTTLRVKTFTPDVGKTLEWVKVSYDYTAGKYKSRCSKACARHGDPEMPWNRAVEIKMTHVWPPEEKSKE